MPRTHGSLQSTGLSARARVEVPKPVGSCGATMSAQKLPVVPPCWVAAIGYSSHESSTTTESPNGMNGSRCFSQVDRRLELANAYVAAAARYWLSGRTR